MKLATWDRYTGEATRNIEKRKERNRDQEVREGRGRVEGKRDRKRRKKINKGELR